MARLGIGVVPLNILFQGRAYRDWLDITPAHAYELFQKDPDAFSTSAPTPADFLDAYRTAGRQAAAIVYIGLSSKFSSTYDVALTARDYAARELPGVRIEVIDSLTATAAEGMIALEAARVAEAGADLDQVVAAALTLREKVSTYVLPDTLRHVYRSGRVPKVAAYAGSMLSIRPVLSISGGVHFSGAVRSRERGLEMILEKMQAAAQGKPVHAAVMHAYAPDDAVRLEGLLRSRFTCTEVWQTELSPIIGYALGTRTVAVAFYTD